MSITVTLTYATADFQCCVCLEPLKKEVWQCPTGRHHLCGPCRDRVPNTCPVDRVSGSFIPDPRWEQVIQQVSQPCADCGDAVLYWLHDEHRESECRMRALPCLFCGDTVRDLLGHVCSQHYKEFTVLQESKEDIIGYRTVDEKTEVFCVSTRPSAAHDAWVVLQKKDEHYYLPLPSFVHLPHSSSFYLIHSHLDQA